MLFASVFTYRDRTEEQQKRQTELFSKWTPPEGVEIKAIYAFADASGGIVLSESNSAAAVFEAHMPWEPFVDWKTSPIIDVAEVIPIAQKVYGWRDSVG